MRAKIDMIGRRFGNLVVISEAGKKDRQFAWVCRCDCGKTTEPIRGTSLRNGDTRSCGCKHYKGDSNRKHSGSKERLYGVFLGMHRRCEQESDISFARYGGRGITVCNEWSDYAKFRDWALKNGYNPLAKRGECTLDRIDNNKGYSPQNCCWATNKEQSNNRRSNVFAEINGETKNLAQWASENGLKYGTIYSRYIRGCTGESLIRKV